MCRGLFSAKAKEITNDFRQEAVVVRTTVFVTKGVSVC